MSSTGAFGDWMEMARGTGLYPEIKETQSSATLPDVVVGNKPVVSFCSNNYLGLADDPRVKAAAIAAIEKYGLGCCGSRLISGNLDIVVELEESLAAFKNKEAAAVFTAGFMANAGTIPAIMSPFMRNAPLEANKGAIFSDALNHTSIVDGTRLAKQEVFTYRHRDMNHLESLLKKSRAKSHRLIVTDGVFSMDGDIAPLDEIVRLAKEYDAMVMVDDAHATGVLGTTGRGTAEHFGVEDDVDMIMGTCSKSLGVAGGFFATSQAMIDFLRVASRTYVFSATMSPPVAAALLTSVRIISEDYSRRDKLFENTKYLKDGLKLMGFDTMDSQTPILPILIGDEAKADAFAASLFEQGVFAPCVRWPAVPTKQARIRCTVMASHETRHLDEFLHAAAWADAKLHVV